MRPQKPYRKTIRHFDGLGHARELTFSCFQRKPLFTPDAALWFEDALNRAREKLPIHIWAYVVMPEHVHLIVWPTELTLPIEELLKSVKGSVSKRVRLDALRRLPAEHLAAPLSVRFWQAGPGYDRNLTEARTLWNAIDYLHLNPVRRGLCARAIDWTRSSARFYLTGEVGRVRIDRETLPDDPR